MLNRDYLIIGAGMAGVTACEGIREHDKKGSVLLVGRENFLPYHRPPLSKNFLKSSSMGTDDLLHEDAEWFKKNRIETRLGTAVRELNIERQLAVLHDGQVVEFRKALLATGSHSRRPPVAGANLGNVFYLNSIRDALAIREAAALEKKRGCCRRRIHRARNVGGARTGESQSRDAESQSLALGKMARRGNFAVAHDSL